MGAILCGFALYMQLGRSIKGVEYTSWEPFRGGEGGGESFDDQTLMKWNFEHYWGGFNEKC